MVKIILLWCSPLSCFCLKLCSILMKLFDTFWYTYFFGLSPHQLSKYKCHAARVTGRDMGSRGDFSPANPKCHVSQTVFPFTIHLIPFVRLHPQFFRLLLILLGYLAGASAQERASPQRYLIVCSRQNVDCSKSPIFSYDCWDRLFTVAGDHLGFRCTVGEGVGVFRLLPNLPPPPQ